MSNKETTYAIIKIGGLAFTAKTFESVKGLHQCSFTDIRKSLDGTLGVVKWTGTQADVPADVKPYVVAYYTYEEIGLVLAKAEWTRGPVQAIQPVEPKPTMFAAIKRNPKKSMAAVAGAAAAAAAAHFLFGLI